MARINGELVVQEAGRPAFKPHRHQPVTAARWARLAGDNWHALLGIARTHNLALAG
ncbi:hypothetical protein [Streptomyces sp. NPDC017673]|uniref:hypothetical protein n=1 Tax=unclassified Streptomyces TaxID=2593676 RepID=UPI00378D98CC